MQAVIGNSLLKTILPSARPFEVRDTRLPGFILRVQPSGVMTYYLQFGRGRRIKIARTTILTLSQAREQARAILAEAYTGCDPRASRRPVERHTLRSFLDQVYEPWVSANLRTAYETLRGLRAGFPDLQERQLSDITPWLIEKWRTARLKQGIKPSSINRALDDLRAALGRAVEWGLLESNPLAGVKRSKVDRRSAPRFLSVEEERSLRAALAERDYELQEGRRRGNAWRGARGYPLLPVLGRFGDHLTPLVLLSLNTGLRRGESFALRWRDVDLIGASLVVRGASAKSGQTRHVPLNAEALAVLRDWGTGAHEDLVFPGRNGDRLNNVKRAFVGVLRAAGIKHFRFHDLRHTFASRLVMAGVDLNTVRELLGHSDYKMTLRYAHLAPEHKAAAVARLVG